MKASPMSKEYMDWLDVLSIALCTTSSCLNVQATLHVLDTMQGPIVGVLLAAGIMGGFVSGYGIVKVVYAVGRMAWNRKARA